MGKKKYYEDFKNLKPLGLDRMPVKTTPRDPNQSSAKKSTMINQQNSSIINQQNSSIINTIGIKNNQSSIKNGVNMERLNSSKTLWGFGIALLIFIIQQVLLVLNVAGPDNMLVNAGIEVVIAVAGFFGVYGIRDALRKMGKG